MNEEILKLAKTTGAYHYNGEDAFEFDKEQIEAFYKAAYNKAIDDALGAVCHDCDCGVPCDCYSPSTARFQIRALEMK